MRRRIYFNYLASATALLLAGGCSLVGSENDDESGPAGAASSGTVRLVTHESFALPKKLIKQFEQDTGYRLKIDKAADAGALTNQLVLSKNNPVADVVFGIDNTFASRAVDEGIFASYAPTLPQGAEQFELEGDQDDALTPIDTGGVCVNVDDAWFAKQQIAPPKSLDDLTKATYRDLFVIPAATTSSPGLAFMLATVGKYGEEWSSYWKDLMANGAKVVKGWTEAYYTDYTFSGGDRPIVVSYDSSPAFTLNKAGTASSTSALLDSCFEQVEYAGVLRGDEDGETNTKGAEAVIDWLLSPKVQAALAPQMYVFPVAADTELPPEWAKFANRAEQTEEVAPADIAANRKAWLEEWNDIISR
ncbi:MAG: thiamine ABC transporter substrate-binding protein [Nocardioidaceae bacterium]|nr:thiamine ABC transporter substrate-binding protein [Nocardioidaceae bacterium]